MLYATDASLYQVEPLGVVIPESVDDAVAAVRACSAAGLAMLPRGGGTSLAGQGVNQAVVIDTSVNCTRVLEVDEERGEARVEAGITIGDLNRHLAGTGWYFAPDPSTARQATVGGCIGNNAAGSHSVLYGRTSESLLGVEVCLADGRVVEFSSASAEHDGRVAELESRVVELCGRNRDEIRARFPKTKRRNAGYALDTILRQHEEGGEAAVDLAQLIAGSEGTLGVTLRARLKLQRTPAAKCLVVAAFESVEEAIDAVVPLLETGPSAIELLDDLVVSLARKNAQCRSYVENLPAPRSGGELQAVLYIEYFSETSETESWAKQRLERVRECVGDGAVEVHTNPGKMNRAWALRIAGEPLLHGIPGNRKPLGFVEDNAVPPERLGEFVRAFRAIVEDEGTTAAFYAHASVGVLHVRPLLDLRDPKDEERMHRIASRVADLAASLGGVMSGEHGDGRVRGPLLERLYGPELMAAFVDLKRIFDPRGLMNPGNIVEPKDLASISRSTRIRPGDTELGGYGATDTFYDYADQHTFGEAVEMCNGAGVCRKKTGGVMCPSYMATRDERHSTRGRGNALRLAISGQLGEGGAPAWSDPDTEETLELCLSCKACKSECPSNVDIARLKAEYTAQSNVTSGIPFATRVMSEIRVLNRIGSTLRWLANPGQRLGFSRVLLERLLRVDRRRSLPSFDASLARSWETDVATSSEAPAVAFFGDCFSMYNEPAVGKAAKRLVEAFGYRIELAIGGEHGCCGRPAISKGNLPRARQQLEALCLELRPLIEEPSVRAILFAEPSCLSVVRDDLLQLKSDVPMELREAFARKAMLVEEFLEQGWEKHPRRPSFAAAEQVTLHEHCHQKAVVGVGTSAALLRRVLGEALTELDSTCCGMAGSFGYDTKTYDLSQEIGELGVLPAAREAGRFVAPGTSCRHQTHDAGVAAAHPVELLAELLEDPQGKESN